MGKQQHISEPMQHDGRRVGVIAGNIIKWSVEEFWLLRYNVILLLTAFQVGRERELKIISSSKEVIGMS